jgi:hypothetical protein
MRYVTAKGSVVAVKVIGESGAAIITAGQLFANKDGKMLPVDSKWWVKDMIEMGELEAITETAKGAGPSPKA